MGAGRGRREPTCRRARMEGGLSCGRGLVSAPVGWLMVVVRGERPPSASSTSVGLVCRGWSPRVRGWSSAGGRVGAGWCGWGCRSCSRACRWTSGPGVCSLGREGGRPGLGAPSGRGGGCRAGSRAHATVVTLPGLLRSRGLAVDGVRAVCRLGRAGRGGGRGASGRCSAFGGRAWRFDQGPPGVLGPVSVEGGRGPRSPSTHRPATAPTTARDQPQDAASATSPAT